jgi:hypothetical protein
MGSDRAIIWPKINNIFGIDGCSLICNNKIKELACWAIIWPKGNSFPSGQINLSWRKEEKHEPLPKNGSNRAIMTLYSILMIAPLITKMGSDRAII